MTPEIHAFVLCHAGSVRSNNEDNYYLQHRISTCVEQKIDSADYAGAPRTFLAAVADGMGGAERGEAASLAAVRALRPASFRHMRRAAQASVRAANDEICAQMRALGARMGSTLTALYISGDRALCSNLGDSRIYLLRGGALTRLTRDHNRAQQLVELGVLTPEQAQRHPARHELTQHLGILPEEMALEPELGPEMQLEAGDRFLLCSDGFWEYVYEMDGLAKKMPVTCGVFVLASLALMGIPPLGGFISKWTIATASADIAFWPGYLGAAALIVSAILTTLYLMSVVVRFYFPLKDGAPLKDGYHEADGRMTGPLLFLSALIVVLSVASASLLNWIGGMV